MTRYIVIVFLFLGLLSCNRNKDFSGDVLIIASIHPSVEFDELSRPHILIDNYIEYRLGHEVLIAHGSDSKAISLRHENIGQIDFYKSKSIVELDNLIEETIKTTDYDSLYIQRKSEHPCAMIFKSGKKIKRLLYFEDCLPIGLDSLNKCLMKIANSTKLEKSPRFKIVKDLKDFEIYLFQNFPPPPQPIKNGFEFVEPKISE